MLAQKKQRMEEGLRQERAGVSENDFSNKRYNEFAALDKQVSKKMAEKVNTEGISSGAFKGQAAPVKKGDEDNASKSLNREVKPKAAGVDMASLFGSNSDSQKKKQAELQKLEEERKRNADEKRKGVFEQISAAEFDF